MVLKINLYWCKRILEVFFIVYKVGYIEKEVLVYCYIVDFKDNLYVFCQFYYLV